MQRWRRLIQPLRNRRGAALYEYALTYFLFASLITFILVLSWWWWNQIVVATAIHDGVRTAAARYGDIDMGYQETYTRILHALGRKNAEEYEGHIYLWAIPEQRSVWGMVGRTTVLHVPYFGDSLFWVNAGSFQRDWRFYGGPPGGWE